jgi:uncharacterized membrane protein
MRCWIVIFLFMISCGNEAGERNPADNSISTTNNSKTDSTDTSTSYLADTSDQNAVIIPQIKKPSGIYEFILPYEKDAMVLHTISFLPGTFQLQEEYSRDSTVMTEGTWAPSQGFIWLYQGNVVRGRYAWKGDTLQYFSPRQKKKFSMSKLTPVTTNPVWQAKKKTGTILYGIGTEPFWSIEIKKQDSIVLSMPEWTEPLRVKLSGTARENKTTIYSAAADSLQVIVSPFFCSDGMSDFTYSHKLTVQYKGQTFNGCGVVF